jgi:hypothetical protein
MLCMHLCVSMFIRACFWGGWMACTLDVSLHVYACKYVCMHVCIHVRKCMHMCMCMHVCAHAYVCLGIYVCMRGIHVFHVCMFWWWMNGMYDACVDGCVCTRTCVQMHVCMHVCTFWCKCMYVCMHTHACIYVCGACVCMYACIMLCVRVHVMHALMMDGRWMYSFTSMLHACICMYVHDRAYACMCMHMYAFVCVCMYDMRLGVCITNVGIAYTCWMHSFMSMHVGCMLWMMNLYAECVLQTQ